MPPTVAALLSLALCQCPLYGEMGLSLCHPDEPWAPAEFGFRPGKAMFLCLQPIGEGSLKEQPSSILDWKRPWTFVSRAVSHLGFHFCPSSDD